MTKEERLRALKALRKFNILEAFSSRQEFVDWQAQVAPFLNFNPIYHSNFINAADVAAHPNLSSYTINPNLARLDVLMKQAITELEHDLIPQLSVTKTDDEELDFAKICRRLRWKQWVGIVGSAAGLALISFLAGRFEFFQKLYDLVWNTFLQR